MNYSSYLSLTVLLLAACSSQPPVDVEAEPEVEIQPASAQLLSQPPNWFAQRLLYAEVPNYLALGYGFGVDAATARAQALRDIAQYMSSQVNSRSVNNPNASYDAINLSYWSRSDSRLVAKGNVTFGGIETYRQELDSGVFYTVLTYDMRPLPERMSAKGCLPADANETAHPYLQHTRLIRSLQAVGCSGQLSLGNVDGVWLLDYQSQVFLLTRNELRAWLFTNARSRQLVMRSSIGTTLNANDYYFVQFSNQHGEGYLSLFQINQSGNAKKLFVNQVARTGDSIFPDREAYDGLPALHTGSGSTSENLLLLVHCSEPNPDFSRYLQATESSSNDFTNSTPGFGMLLADIAACQVASMSIQIRL